MLEFLLMTASAPQHTSKATSKHLRRREPTLNLWSPNRSSRRSSFQRSAAGHGSHSPVRTTGSRGRSNRRTNSANVMSCVATLTLSGEDAHSSSLLSASVSRRLGNHRPNYIALLSAKRQVTATGSAWLQHLAVDPLDGVRDACCGQDVRVGVAVLRPASNARLSHTARARGFCGSTMTNALRHHSTALLRRRIKW